MVATFDDLQNATVVLGRPGLVAGTGIEPGEKASIWARFEALEARAIADLAGVDMTGIVDGDALVYDEETGLLVPGTAGGTLAYVQDRGADLMEDVERINFGGGLHAVPNQSHPNTVNVASVFGTSANTVAEGDHTHVLPTTYREPIIPQDYMSSGTRPLASRAVTLPAGKSCLVEAWLAPLQVRGADPGPCYYRLSLTIAGNTRQSPPAGPNGYWAVQGVPDKVTFGHERTISGTGAAITVSASIAWGGNGGGFHTDAGELVIRVTPNR